MKNFRKNKPESTGGISFHLPGVIKNSLPSGLEYLYVVKQKLPIVQFYYVIPAGSIFDNDKKKGLAYLTSLLIDEGAGEYDSLQLDSEFEKIGTSFRISVDNDLMYFSILCLEEYFERSVELLSKIINEPHLAESDFQREKKQQLAKIIQSNDNPGYVASKVFQKIIFSESKYAFPIIGLREHVESLTLGNVQTFYNDVITNSGALLAGVGSIDQDKFHRVFLKHFRSVVNKLPQQSIIKKPIFPLPKIFLFDKKDAAQSEIRIGHFSGHKRIEDYFSKLIMNNILGGQFNSRINSNLREKHGYTYGASSAFNYNLSCSQFVVSTSVQTEVTGKAVTEIIKELTFIRERIFDEEIIFAKSYLTNRFPAMFETYNQVAQNILNERLYKLPPDFLSGYIEKLNTICKEEIYETAKQNILPHNVSIVIVGNRDKIKSDLSNLNYEITEVDLDGNPIN